MKKLLAAVALAAATFTSPAIAGTDCTTEDGFQFCSNADSGTYSARSLRNPDIWIDGKCGTGGGARWGDIPFPVVEELHSTLCPGRSLSPVRY